MEQIIWQKLCQLSKLKYERNQYLKRSDEHDSNNNTWLAANSLHEYHRTQNIYDTLLAEVKELSKQIDSKIFREMVIQSHHLYNYD